MKVFCRRSVTAPKAMIAAITTSAMRRPHLNKSRDVGFITPPLLRSARGTVWYMAYRYERELREEPGAIVAVIVTAIPIAIHENHRNQRVGLRVE